MAFGGPFMNHVCLVVVNVHSKWLEAQIMNNIPAPVTTEKLCQIFTSPGLPDWLVSDNDTLFTSEAFQEFL